MAVLDILIAPHPILKTKSKPIDAVTDEIRTQMDDMLETMYDAPGIGLAANQVGLTNRVIVMDVAGRDAEEGEEFDREPICMANPEITWESDDLVPYEEGCLSLPEQFANVDRPAEIKVRYLDRDGSSQEMQADGVLAVCIQHEIDHLNGVLFTDHLSALKRNMLLRKLAKWKKETRKG